MPTPKPWLRAAIEGAVIVTSILLAFAVDAWWDGRIERREERDALELLLRDLDGTVAQLEEYGLIMDDLAEAGYGAYGILSDGEQRVRQDELATLLTRTLFRRTLRLPRTAYSDLVSTGTLRLVRSPEIRNRILRFYESAERSEEIVEKNSAKYVDDVMSNLLVESGLIVPRLPEEELTSLVQERNRRTRARFGGDPPYPRHPLLDLPSGAPEWNRLMAGLMMFGQGVEMSGVISDRLLEEASDLARALRSYLSEGVG